MRGTRYWPSFTASRQARVLHAVADEVGAHRQHDVDRQLAVCVVASSSSLTKATASSRDVLDLAAPPEAEQLLELIDDDEDVVVGGNARLADGVDEAERAAAQRGFEQHAVGRSPARRCRAPSTSGASSAAARWPIGSSPGRRIATRQLEPACTMEPAVQRRNQAGADQRRLAAAGGADDRQEAVGARAGAADRRSPFRGRRRDGLRRARTDEGRGTDWAGVVGGIDPARASPSRLQARRRTAARRRATSRPTAGSAAPRACGSAPSPASSGRSGRSPTTGLGLVRP